MNWYWQCVCDHVWWWFKLFKKLISIQKITVWKTDYTSEVCLRHKLQLYKKYQYLVRKPLQLHFFFRATGLYLMNKKRGNKEKKLYMGLQCQIHLHDIVLLHVTHREHSLYKYAGHGQRTIRGSCVSDYAVCLYCKKFRELKLTYKWWFTPSLKYEVSISLFVQPTLDWDVTNIHSL